jgi:hypothetical protein
MQVEQGIYFFHISFLKEVSDKWLSKGQIEQAAEIFMTLVMSGKENANFMTCDRTVKELITCDRTIQEISKPKYTLKAVPGFIDLITEKFLPSENGETDDDIYSLKVASFKRITPYKIFFIVSDNEKSRLKELARKKGYTLQIISPEDFS